MQTGYPWGSIGVYSTTGQGLSIDIKVCAHKMATNEAAWWLRGPATTDIKDARFEVDLI